MPVTHTFVSAKPPAPDPTQVGSAEWNAMHTVSIVNADVSAAAAIEASKLLAAGLDTQIQFNDGGAFAGDVNFTWNKISRTLFLKGIGDGTSALIQGYEDSGIQINGGNSTTLNGGSINLYGGNSSSFIGGNIIIQAGSSGTGIIGGNINIRTSNTSRPGNITFTGGNALTDDYDGGSITFTAGIGHGIGQGGQITFMSASGGAGADGSDIVFLLGTKGVGGSQNGRIYMGLVGGYSATLDLSNIASSDKNFAFPNMSGTLALTSDIPSFPLSPTLGGTGVANAIGSTLTLGGATTISTGGTIALGGFTLTVPATGIAGLLGRTQTWTGQNGFTRGAPGAGVFIGAGTGNTTSTGTGNIGIGDEGTLPSLTTGVGNVALGQYALFSHQTGDFNFALGYLVLANDDGGHENVAIGAQSMQQQTAAVQNVGVGSRTGAQNKTGSFNTWIGFQAGFGVVNQSNNYNVGIGFNAASGITTGNNNIYIGSQAGQLQTNASYQFIVDSTQSGSPRASATEEVENSFLYGNMAAGGRLQLNIPSTTNNAIVETLRLQAYVSTAATGSANGFGTGLPFYAETATNATYQPQGMVSTYWVDATNATRKGTLALSAYDTAERKGIEIRANGSTPDIVLLGDTWWEGEGFGLPYASFYGNDIAWTQVNAVQNTWYEISDADITDGQLNLVTHDGSGKLTIVKAGRYRIDYHLVAMASIANKDLQSGISVSGTEQNDGIDHEFSSTPSEQLHMGSTAILDLAAGATIELSLRTTDAGTPDISVEHINLSMVMVGGT